MSLNAAALEIMNKLVFGMLVASEAIILVVKTKLKELWLLEQ